MTVGNTQATDRPGFMRKMDTASPNSDIIGGISTLSDDSLFTDFLDVSIYASSPNTLVTYEQEKMDMQSSYTTSNTNTVLGTSTSTQLEDFDLKDQYEKSQDLCQLPLGVPTSLNMPVNINSSVGTGNPVWGSLEKLTAKTEGLLQSEELETSSGPTLAQLNDPLNDPESILKDIECYIYDDMYSRPEGKKPEDSCSSKTSTVTPKWNIASIISAVPSTSTSVGYMVPQVQVKTEPLEYDTGQFPSKQSTSWFQGPMSTANSNRGQFGAASATSDMDNRRATTLQKLLQSQQTFPPSKPSNVSVKTEGTGPQALPSPGKKRAFSLTGLEAVEEKWQEIKSFIEPSVEKPKSGPVVKRERNDSTCSALTSMSSDSYQAMEDFDSDSEQHDGDEDWRSDSDDEGMSFDINDLDPNDSLVAKHKEKQYFWQYNVQSKGPKGTRVQFSLEENPHQPVGFEDPVFDPASQNLPGIAGSVIKHGGKARKGDGNDILPNPRKLCMIGLQLKKISKQINDFAPVSELPSAIRNKTRKEKNKLASRACRLKKKAQHEANKVKLYGLEQEHKQLLQVLKLIRLELIQRTKREEEEDVSETASQKLERFIKENLTEMIASNTANFVNSVVRKVESGDVTGGLDLKAARAYCKE